ncbi:single-stranded-DNA-specific exonuclease RecJ [Indiicoccus explosivorum]|uniref:single-stranded-DNA-specific exonuclease RecJ n=1 Tax=Indiicoccus explosivorum TaxID=1917864 RepID=UPI000B451425|nr:single-stranded-DNA-specific exonuclease RecJ [Indiicoccus explosivorum]
MIQSKKQWRLMAPDEYKTKQLEDALGIPAVLAKILVSRGMDSPEKARAFLTSDETAMHDPFLLKDMDVAVDRIRRAIEADERIVVYGDYDADGVTSTSVMMTVLRDLGADASFVIPNRFRHGYGPNTELFEQIAADGCQLLITVDNGVSGIEQAKRAAELGVDVIITDHHDIGTELPEALAVIHPRHPESTYPFGELAGVGVAFKLAHALYGEMPDHLLELAAIGTVADLVPLHDENRYLVKEGLERLKRTSRAAVAALCEVAGISAHEITEETIGFGFGPRINAIGRLQDAGPAVDLLLTEDAEEARGLARKLDSLNKERQAIVAKITEEAVAQVEERHPEGTPHVIVVAQEGWNPGVVGIVASRLVETFYRPAIVLSLDPETGKAKGSARSIEGFHLYNELAKNRDILPHFGGHPMAAGMTLGAADVDELRKRLIAQAENILEADDLIPETAIDIPVEPAEISVETLEAIRTLAPFGMGFSKPKFYLAGVSAVSIRKIGAAKNHLKMELAKQGVAIDAVGFSLGHLADELTPDVKVEAIGDLQINEWNGRKKPQLMLEDLRTDEWQLYDIRGIRQAARWVPLIPETGQLFVAFRQETAESFQAFIKAPICQADGLSDADCEAQHLVLLDLPDAEEKLQQVLRRMRPKRVYCHFHTEESHYFGRLPDREEFKWLFGVIKQRGRFDFRKDGDMVAKHRGWSLDSLKFMLQVFFELGFVKINNGLTEIADAPSKRDLSEAPSYQKRQRQMELEQKLLYASYQELKKWFDVHLSAEEEKVWI